METFVKADIFFFVATIATVCLTTLLAIILWYVLKIVRIIHRIISAADERLQESQEVVHDVLQRLRSLPILGVLIPRKKKINKNNKN